ncbi:MAG: hypothetical protein J6569_05040 [Gilliamella sp.]|nr:hypothetical protein [Gilliamella sp.]MCO6548186.1 hypothetical protein [Gilliamella sp.]MCO6554471.1 hypothetical protein [Gilliamella sp.]
MIGLSKDDYTTLFVMSCIIGWCAHWIEELNFDDCQLFAMPIKISLNSCCLHLKKIVKPNIRQYLLSVSIKLSLLKKHGYLK